MKKRILKYMSIPILTIALLSVFFISASAETYASPINVFTYLDKPEPTENLQYVALHYTSGSSYLLAVGCDGNENISFSWYMGNASMGNILYASNNGASGGFIYYYFINLETCNISNCEFVSVPPGKQYLRVYEENYLIDGFYSYGLPCSWLGSYTQSYALQVTWSYGTYSNISTIRSQVAGINNNCSSILGYLNSLSVKQDTANSYLNQINNNLAGNNQKLDQLINSLKQQKEELIDNTSSVSSAYNLDNSGLESEQNKYNASDVTIPEFNSDLVEGSSSYWSFVEQILSTSGLLPLTIFALVIGLVSFIIGKKV